MECSRLSPKANFVDLVLSWSPQDIVDHDLYKNQVDKIPLSFESVDQYLDSYSYPLLEETRAELASAIEVVYTLPFAEITSFEKRNTFLFDVKVDHWENIQSDRGSEAYRIFPGDVVLVSNMKPETAFNVRHAGYVFFLACVTNTVDNKSGPFKIITSQEIEVADVEKKSFYVVCLMNLNRNERIWNALGMRRNLKIIESVLTKNDLGLENCEFCPLKCKRELEENFGSALLSKLNESQLKAVLSSLSKIECTHKSSVDLIWGPPGTGKTTTLSTLLYILSKMNVRTVVCGPTDAAITELASRVIQLVRSSFKTESEDSLLPCSLGGMLIYANKDNLKVGSHIGDIILNDRIERLEKCLAPLLGLKHCVSAMIGFLEGCVNHEITKGKSLLEFARDRFSRLETPLRECMLTFVTHLPRSFVHEQSLQSMDQLMCHLDSIKISLFEDNNITSEKLECIFGSEPFVDTSSLMCIKSECVAILRSLQAYLDKLDLPVGANRSSIAEFCFQKASLIFCTISSSYKLHSVNMEPITVLLIDKAARVKECETIIPLNILDVRHAVLVGDEKQLPATVNSELSEGAGFGRSLFERLSLLGHSKHLLNVQYKMHPSISQFPNLSFYRNQILDAPCVQSQSYVKRYLEGRMFGPYSFINIPGGKEELDDVSQSIRNNVEVATVVKLVRKLFKAWNGSNENLSIGLISPYAAQVAAIRDRLRQKLFKAWNGMNEDQSIGLISPYAAQVTAIQEWFPHMYENLEGFTVEVSTVDGFQNGEKDIIIISTAGSHNCGAIGFLFGPQGTNVALTRARHSLWIVGDEKALSVSDSVWEALILDAKRRQCFFSANEDYDIGKTIVKVKEGLQELEDLFGGESVLFNNSRWKVHFSDGFFKSFLKLKSFDLKNAVICTLRLIARGLRPNNINQDLVCKGSSYIVKQFKVTRRLSIVCPNLSIVCSVDIIEDSAYEQVLKVWDLLMRREETPTLLRRLDNISSMYTDDFVSHCNEKLLEGNLQVPKSWPLSESIIKFKSRNSFKNSSDGTVGGASHIEKSEVSESLLLMKFYSLPTGMANYFITDLEGRELDLPFEVTREERTVIMFPKSSFVLRRSGMEKTNILTMMLFKNIQQYRITSQDSMIADDNSVQTNSTPLRQLFVTVSPKQCYAVKKNVSHLKSFASGNFFGNSNFFDMDDIEDMTEFKDIPDTFVGIQLDKYPLIITFHKFLMMLDGTIGNSYAERLHNVRNVQSSRRSESLVALKTFIRKKEVTHDRFLSFYWPHFNAKLIKNLDPSRVFTEIISHIKGSLPKGGTCDDSIRSREEYTSLSQRRVSTLSAEKRDIIYDIFHDYEKMKLKRGEFDLADFVIDIHLRLKNENPMVDKMDFVYIDEAQELTMRQIALLRCICKNVDEGIVFSDETAQTIIGGINSRSHFVCENNKAFSKSMLDYWKSLSAVQVIKFEDSFANELQRESSPEELKSMAIKLFWEKKYAMATKCFERAGEDTWGKWAKASGLRATSDALRGSNPKGARIMLREAAEIFDSIDRVDSAAECFCELGEYERAGRIYMKKSGTSELRKAGECFSLVGHHKIAADVYAKGYFFKECLSSCARGKYFDLGLQYIEDWNCETVDKFALEFLKKCPSEYFRTKDNAPLLRLVQFFHTKESKRNCLMSLDRLDFLLNLEVKSGNLNEAAEIAELLGDIMCAVDLLEKSEQLGKASSLVLSNVLSNSLWVSGTQGWPLKKFPQKDELLTKAMSASRKVSGTFHTSVCAEAQILSHERTILSELARCYNASKEYKNCTAEILSVRKLLDAHFEVDPADYEWDTKLRIDPRLFDEKISCSRVSGGTLLYVWNLWKEHSLEILDCINSLKSVDRPARCTDKGIVQFCLNYFGVKLQHNSDIISYLLLKPNASWVRRSVDKWSKVLTIDADCFALAARNYWHQELVSVGFRVLEVFRALHEFSVAKMPLSMYCQGLCLTSVYDVTRFFIESNSLDMNESDKGKLHDFMKLSTTKYFELVFPLDSRRSLSGNLISLRETETSCDLLSEIISDKIKIGLGLRYGEIGRVVIMLLGSGKLNHYVYLRIAESFNECSSSWISLIRNINSAQVDLGHLLHQALAETCDNANWRGKMDYISPNCFFYVVERLLILVTYSQGFFLAMKSSFVEYLISLPSDADPSAHFVTYEKSYSERIFDFVDSVVQQCLFSIHDSAEWINNSGIDCEYYFPLLMLRLVMILCLSCLNSELSFNVILKLLGIPQIRSQLPSEFCEALLQERTNDDSSYIVAVIALALEVVGDPLVIVCSGGTRPEFVCPPGAVFVDLKSFSCRNEILKALVSSTESFEIGVPPVVSDQQVNLEVNWDLIHEMSESLELLRNRNDGDFKSLVLKKKEEMEDYLRFLTDVTSQLIEQRYFYGEDKNELTEAAGMIEELNRLFPLSETSEFDSEVISEIGRLLKDLEAKRVELDRLVSLFSMQSDRNGNVIVCPLVNCVRRKSEELLAAPANCISSQVAECSQGKGKGKKYNNKSRKGKKGGRRK